MKESNSLSVKSTVILNFNDNNIREISYNSFLPELNKVSNKRSKLRMEKQNKSIVFHIESADITAFKATIADIVGFGKIISDSLKIVDEKP